MISLLACLLSAGLVLGAPTPSRTSLAAHHTVRTIPR